MDIHDPKTRALVNSLSNAVGERFYEEKVDGRPGYLSESKVVGILPPNSLPSFKKRLSTTFVSALSRSGENIIVNGDTSFSARIVDAAINALHECEADYIVFADKKNPAPLLIQSSIGNIIIAPIIEG